MSQSQHNTNILFRDLYGITVVLFIGLVVILANLDTSKSDGETAMPGNLTATISWPEGNFDIDMWLDGPGEPVPVGYSNKGGLLWNLLRDDLGKWPDYSKMNFENAYTRGLPPGDYRINVQCYRCPQLPMEVNLEVAKKAEGTGSTKIELVGTSLVTLRSDHEEKTGLAFTIDGDGNVVPDSMTTLFKPLRSSASK